MKIIDLSPDEKSLLEQRHRRCSSRKEGDRIKAVLLYSEGWTVAMICQALRLHESTVTRHIDDFTKGKLTLASGGSTSKLSDNQSLKLVAHLEEHTYRSTQEIIAFIQTSFGVTYSVPGLNKWLHRHEFSYKKPKGYPHKADRVAQENFIADYHALKANLHKGEAIYFMDSCHPSMATKINYGWIRTGKNKPIETSASRTRMNIAGALCLSDLGRPIIATYSTIDSESIVDFIEQIRRYSQAKGIIHLVLDQAGYHRSQLVVQAAKRYRIKLRYLPPYSPNLNPIERLWKVMNEKVRNNRFFESPAAFKEAIQSFFTTTIPNITQQLTKRINDNFQSLNYAFSG
jgi:transposase